MRRLSRRATSRTRFQTTSVTQESTNGRYLLADDERRCRTGASKHTASKPLDVRSNSFSGSAMNVVVSAAGSRAVSPPRVGHRISVPIGAVHVADRTRAGFDRSAALIATLRT